MAVTGIVNIKNEKIGEVELNDDLFCVEVKPYILHDIVKMQLANRRSGNACTKTRSEVHGSNAKPWRQKGTGRARSGSKRSPVWRGGGTVFGPKPRSYRIKLTKKVRRLGIKMALSTRFSENRLIVLDNFDLDEIKTKNFISVMGTLNLDNALVVIPENNEKLEKSSRNAVGYKVIPTGGVNVYDVLLYKNIILLYPCVSQLEKRLLS
jgi:large subunit ribosomal protein L4